MPADQSNQTERRKPTALLYLLSAALLIGSVGVFAATLIQKAKLLRERIDPMPRFVGPTGEEGVVITVDAPGKQNIFHENKGTLDGRSFDTFRRQVWTNFNAPSMTCVVTRVETGEEVEVRLPGVGETQDKRVVTKDLVFAYDFAGRQAHSAWVFETDTPGDYRLVLQYKEAVALEVGDIEIPPELTRADKKEMTQVDGEAYEADRRDAVERASLAQLEPVDVLFAVGPDPTAGGFFELFGLKGAATVLAFGFTFSVLIALVTFMLRAGHVTPRGEMADIKRLGDQAQP